MGTCEPLSIVLDEVGGDEGETGRTQGMESLEEPGSFAAEEEF